MMSNSSENTEKRPITYKGAIFPWHCDHMGHMNVMWYVSKFDEATWHQFASIGITPNYLRENNLGMAAVDMHVQYKAELLAGDLIYIRTHWLEIKEKSIKFRHEMFNSETETIAATCDIIAVHTNLELRKAHAFDMKIINKAKAAL